MSRADFISTRTHFAQTHTIDPLHAPCGTAWQVSLQQGPVHPHAWYVAAFLKVTCDVFCSFSLHSLPRPRSPPSSTMASLLSLPTELIVDIYTHATLQSAASLSAVSKRLHDIWLENTDYIVESTIRQLPAWEDAVELALLDQTWSESDPLPVPTGRKPPIQLYGRFLLRLALWASVAIAEWDIHIAERYPEDDDESPEEDRDPDSPYTSPYASFYLIHKIIFACDYPDHAQLHDSIRLAVDACLTFSSVSVHELFSEFLLHGCRDDHDELRLYPWRSRGGRPSRVRPSDDEDEEKNWNWRNGMRIETEEWNAVGEVLERWRGFEEGWE
jgi:hypothetical protein